MKKNFIFQAVILMIATWSVSAIDIKHKVVIPSFSPPKGTSDNIYYNYRGSNPNRNTFLGMPYENVDPFTGSLNLVHTDFTFPGKNGLDVKIMRYYNSSIWRDIGFAYAGILDISTTTAGLGWSMHMGRVIRPSGAGTPPPCDSKDQPLIELADGSQHVAYTDKNYTSKWITKEYWKYELIADGDYQLTMTNGIKYIFADEYAYTVDGYTCYPVKKIIDTYTSNVINIYYKVVSTRRVIDYIVDTYNRNITFNYNTTTALRLSSITANSKTYNYNYSFINWAGINYPLLTGVTAPGNLASWQYSYTTSAPLYELQSITTPQGGALTYAYTTRSFSVNAITYNFYVVQSRSVGGGTWNFNYYTGDDGDSTKITAPNGVLYVYKYDGARSSYTSGNKWKIGLPKYDRIGTMQKKTYSWTQSPKISDDREWLFDAWDSQIFSPRLSQIVTNRDGVNYTTNYTSYDNYGNPTAFNESGQGTRSTTISYWTGGQSQNIVDRPENQTITVDGESFTISYQYNSNGNKLSENKYGVTTSYTYLTEGNLNKVTDAEGHWVEYSNYEYGVPRAINHHNVYTINRTVNWEGTVSSESNGRGYYTYYTYDGLNRVTRSTPPAGDYTDFTYAANCSWEKATRSAKWTQKNFDNLGRLTGTENIVGVKTTISYNNMGWKSYESYPHTSTNIGRNFSYDNLGRISTITNPDGTTITYTYSNDQMTVKDERNNNTTFAYKAFGNPDDRWVMSVNDNLTGVASYTRNALGSVKQVAKSGITRTYNYNTKNFLISEVNPETGTVSYTPNNIGLVVQRIDPVRSISYAYDNVNRLVSINYPDATDDVTITYNYDVKISNVTPVVSNSYSYDNANRMISKTTVIEGRTYTLGYHYDGRDNIDIITYPDNTQISYTYDGADRVTGITGFASNIQYHPSGGEASITCGNGITTTINYDNRYRVSSINAPNIISYGYQYDGCGNLITLTDNLNGAYNQSFGYDIVNRLTSATGPWGSGTYTYDNHGNRTQKTVGGTVSYAYSSNRLSTAGNWGYVYNGFGEVTQVTDYGYGWLYMSYDPAGRLYYFNDMNFGYPANYWYDGDGVRVKQHQRNGAPKAKSLLYDNELITPSIDVDLLGPVPQYPPYIRYYVSNGGNTFAEYDENNALQCKYIYLNGKHLAKIEGANTYYFYCDNLGTPKAITNSSGVIVRKDNYYPFGEQYNYTGTYKNNHKFTGKERDWSSLDYFGARYYDCRIGRFLTPDPALINVSDNKIIENPLKHNRYSYCLNNPLKYIDPKGEIPILALFGAYVAALGADMPGLNADMITLSADVGNKDWAAVAGDLVGFAIPIVPAAMTGKVSKGLFIAGNKIAEDVLVLGRGPLSRLKNLAIEEGGRISTTSSKEAKEIFKQNYRDIRKADKIIQYMDNIPTTLDESLQKGGQFSRAEVFMINQRKDLLAKTIRKIEN